MRRSPLIVCATTACLLLGCALFTGDSLPSGGEDAAAHAAKASPGPASVAGEQDAYALFSHMDGDAITGLTLTTDESAYVFRCSGEPRVSVNGQKADYDVYTTLLEQILTLPVVAVSPFTPSSDASVTLTLYADSVPYTVFFFHDGDEDSPYVSLISGDAGNPCYQRTDRWRLGTMLLACEGTRIQDEKGVETPFTD